MRKLEIGDDQTWKVETGKMKTVNETRKWCNRTKMSKCQILNSNSILNQVDPVHLQQHTLVLVSRRSYNSLVMPISSTGWITVNSRTPRVVVLFVLSVEFW